MEYAPKLSGPKVYLAPMRVDDAPQYVHWLNDLEVTQFLPHSRMAISMANEPEILERLSKEHNYSIVTTDEDKLIGTCGFHNVVETHRHAEVGIFIGDKSTWGKGYGTEALFLLCWYGFNFLNYHNIELHYIDANQRGQKSYEKLGFREIGRRREAIRRRNQWYDLVYMDVLTSELRAPSGLEDWSL